MKNQLLGTLLVIILGVYAWFFLHDLNPSGVLNISYNLCKPSPYISEFSPHGRVLDVEHKIGYCQQKMVIDPVYIDVRLPQQYDRVTMTLRHKKEESVPLSFGVRTSLEGWRWDIRTAQLHEKSKLLTYEDWERAFVQFDLAQVPLDHRRIRFMLSSPRLDDSRKGIVIREVHFHFEKPPFGVDALKRWVRSFFLR